MKKIVRGNDFTLRIPVMRIVDGKQVAFPLPACTDIQVNVTNAYRRVALAYTIDVTDDNVLLARVEGDAIALGTYALEVKGKIFGNDWRSNEYEQFMIVNNNAAADTELGGQDEGEKSVEMDTALVILAPTDELTGLIKDANTAIDTVKELNDTLTGQEADRQRAEQGRADAETARTQAEQARAKAETARVQAEQSRAANEKAREKAEVQRESDLSEAVADAQGKAKGAVEKCEADTQAAVKDAQAKVEAAVAYSKTETDKAVAQAKADTASAVKKADSDTQSAIKKAQADTAQAISDMNTQATETINELNKAKDKAVADCQQAVEDAEVSADYDPMTGELIIKTGKEE